jgi:glyoxylase-like metal-dependent hydrolase (beta-lactamase superfamily II)
MIVTPTTVGSFQENTYLVVDDTTRRAVLVDPGAEGPRLLDLVRRSGAELEAIWLTHAHVDHIGGIAAIRRQYDVPIHLHPADRVVYDAAEDVARMYGLDFDAPPPPDVALAEGQTLRVGSAAFDVLHVPGHAPGHVLFVGEELIFGGDLIFAGSIGRTDLPFSDPAAMQDSLRRAGALPEHLVVHPGHGRPTTIGSELRSNPFLSGLARVLHSTSR